MLLILQNNLAMFFQYIFYQIQIDMLICSIKLLFCNVFIRSFDY